MADWFLSDVQRKLRSVRDCSLASSIIITLPVFISIFMGLARIGHPSAYAAVEGIWNLEPLLFPMLIVWAVFLFISFIIGVCCVIKMGNLKVLLLQKDLETTKRIIPWFNNCFIYAILAIFIPLVFNWVLFIESKITLGTFIRLTK